MVTMKKINNYLNLIAGLFLIAFSFNLFLSPNNLASGGISGLSLIIHKLWNIDESIFIFIVNIILLIVSYKLLGKEKTKNTILGSLLFPIFINLTSKITVLINIESLDTLIIAILGGVLSGLGYGIIFKSGFTSGGTDIINQIMEKYLRMPISKYIIIVDGFITILSLFVFDLSTTLYAFIVLILISLFSNKAMIGDGKSKTLYISSSKYKEIKEYLHEELKIDSTDFECVGGYKNKKGKMIMTVIENIDYYRVKEAIELIDPDAFITVTDSYHMMNANLSIRK
jgi:uncharacterized membrane-anchored protein YitT (DUF2179 family)